MAHNQERVTLNLGQTLDTAQSTKKTGAEARDNTDLLHQRAQNFSYEGAQGEYGQAVVEKDRFNQRLANEQWDGHDRTSNALTNGAHSLVNARDMSINRLGGMG
ncbi:hypothetical protein [Amycolatopsis sp. BJA-103]|uniref:hypothetical protein n=1 Tax=unclassified Amycolatopsis TaxID=2618356 RepID=UPI000C77357F|nr:hypothetical protein [Amycolatopsis sp. BJA-103]AUI61001.1 hypothetical protein BKN51_24300 [Amycolatopsis sp. BJA-103]PNE21713.1 hypothetical protein B1H26_08180 [Amycolatopsis sp. BJA-103]